MLTRTYPNLTLQFAVKFREAKGMSRPASTSSAASSSSSTSGTTQPSTNAVVNDSLPSVTAAVNGDLTSHKKSTSSIKSGSSSSNEVCYHVYCTLL